MRDVLRPKRDAMLKALEINLDGLATWSAPLGGYYIWVTMGAGFDTDALATQALAAGVEFLRGSMFFASESPPRRNLRLCFSYESVARIRDGVAVLGRSANAQAAGLAVAAP